MNLVLIMQVSFNQNFIKRKYNFEIEFQPFFHLNLELNYSNILSVKIFKTENI